MQVVTHRLVLIMQVVACTSIKLNGQDCGNVCTVRVSFSVKPRPGDEFSAKSWQQKRRKRLRSCILTS